MYFHKLLYVIAGGFVFGIFLRSFFDLGWIIIFFLMGLGAAILFYALLSPKKSRYVIFLVSLFIVTLALGVMRFHISDSFAGDKTLDLHIEEKILTEGVIIEEPDERDTHTKLVVDLEHIIVQKEKQKVEAKALVSTELFPSYEYGDRITIEGTLKKPNNFENERGKIFDYVSYLAKDDIFYQISFADIEVVSQKEGNKIRQILFSIKHKFLDSIERVIPAPESALMGGVLLGTKQSLGKELKQDFIDTGLVHIVVLSGYNVTIVAEAIIRSLSFLPFLAGIGIGAFSIALFAIMTGAGATIVRASIMAILALLARATGRIYDITRALIIAGVFMLIHNPWILVFDVSFQLSFLATIGLIFVAPRVEKYLGFMPKLWELRGIFAATLATQLFVLPYILYKIGTLSIVAPIVNLIVLPFIPITMFFGFLTGMIGFVSHIFSLPFAWVSYALLHAEIGVVEWFSELPFASVNLKSFPLILVILIYALIIWWMTRKAKQKTL